MIDIKIGKFNIFFSKKVIQDIERYKQDTKEKNEAANKSRITADLFCIKVEQK